MKWSDEEQQQLKTSHCRTDEYVTVQIILVKLILLVHHVEQKPLSDLQSCLQLQPLLNNTLASFSVIRQC